MVCTTIVRRPTCSGTASALSRPGGEARKKLVFDSIVVVLAPGRQVEPGHLAAQLVGEGHIGAAMHDAVRVDVPLVGIDLADDLVLVAGDDR